MPRVSVDMRAKALAAFAQRDHLRHDLDELDVLAPKGAA
jgi:hypothetical protein